jgi:hypothetical protein
MEEDHDGRRYLVPNNNYSQGESNYITRRTNDILRERIQLGLTGGGKKKPKKKTSPKKKTVSKKKKVDKIAECKKLPRCQNGSRRDYKCRTPEGIVALTAKEYNALMKKRKTEKKGKKVKKEKQCFMSSDDDDESFFRDETITEGMMPKIAKSRANKSKSFIIDDDIFDDTEFNLNNLPPPMNYSQSSRGYAALPSHDEKAYLNKQFNDRRGNNSSEIDPFDDGAMWGTGGKMRRCPTGSKRKKVCVTKRNKIVKPKRKVKGGCDGCPYCSGGGCMACSGSGIMAGGRCPTGSRRKKVCVTKKNKIVKAKKAPKSDWLKFVGKVYREGKKKNPNYTYQKAMKDASKKW